MQLRIYDNFLLWLANAELLMLQTHSTVHLLHDQAKFECVERSSEIIIILHCNVLKWNLLKKVLELP